MSNKFNTDLDRCRANYQPLTPLRFLDRAMDVYPNRVAAIHRGKSYTWREYGERCRRLGRALIGAGVQRGDTVAIMATNVLAMLEAQFGVPYSGAVINCINSRLDAAAVAFILEHSEAKIFFVDRQLADVAREAIAQSGRDMMVIDISEPEAGSAAPVGKIEYEDFLATAKASVELRYPEDEWDAIALNYTSGTTGNPKGVVYHHRGAYLNALGQVMTGDMVGRKTVYLWTLPLFHCNGWCYAWGLAAIGATSVCLRKVAAEEIYAAIAAYGVTHFCAAPTVLSFLIAGKPANWVAPKHPIEIICAGASPPVAVMQQTIELGFKVLHVYGMTELHGVVTLCEEQEEWGGLGLPTRCQRYGRQGVRTVVTDEMMVADPATYQPIPADGETMGEVLFRGNLGMKGYLKNPKATKDAFAGDWYHSGDLAVLHPDGYMEIKDRAKDIIISGGENVSSLEVEDVLYTHPDVLNVAVVAVPDAKWGEVPCAVVELKPDRVGSLTEEQVIAYCRQRLAGFKTPRHVIFEPIVRTATGKLQKFKLRDHVAQVIANKAKAA